MAAEPKRPGAGNKAPVALPNSGPPPPPSPTVSLEAALSGVVGARVRVTTSPPTSSTYEGLLYTADPVTNLIVLSIPPSPSSPSSSSSSSSNPTTNSTPASPNTNTFTILPIPHLTSFTILSLPSSSINPPSSPHPPHNSSSLPTPHPLDLSALHSRTLTTLIALKSQDAKRGRGVTREAQDIFDGISRMHPARWMGTSMVVNENVVIEQPYREEDCRLWSSSAPSAGSGGKGDKGERGGSTEQGLARIKKVLAMERDKLALRRGFGTGGLGGNPGAKRGGLTTGGLGAKKGG